MRCPNIKVTKFFTNSHFFLVQFSVVFLCIICPTQVFLIFFKSRILSQKKTSLLFRHLKFFLIYSRFFHTFFIFFLRHLRWTDSGYFCAFCRKKSIMFFKTWGSFNNNEGGLFDDFWGIHWVGRGRGFCSRKKRRAGRGVYMYMQYNCVCGGDDWAYFT